MSGVVQFNEVGQCTEVMRPDEDVVHPCTRVLGCSVYVRLTASVVKNMSNAISCICSFSGRSCNSRCLDRLCPLQKLLTVAGRRTGLLI